MKWMAVAACLAVLSATPVLAQTEPSPEAVAASRAAAKAEGDALLAKAGATAFFDNISEDTDQNGGVVLRHKGSGLYCLFQPGHGDTEVILFRPDGEDVGCKSSTNFDFRIVYATRSSQTLDQAMAQSVAALKLKHPKAKPYRGPLSPMGTMAAEAALRADKFPPSRTERFIDGKRYESVSLAVVDGWEIKLRISGDIRYVDSLTTVGDGLGWLMYLGRAGDYLKANAAKPAAAPAS